MFTSILLVVFGAIVASIVWFFVWRNNKKDFVTAIEAVDLTGLPQRIIDEINRILAKYKKS
jgi:hypothetical protein